MSDSGQCEINEGTHEGLAILRLRRLRLLALSVLALSRIWGLAIALRSAVGLVLEHLVAIFLLLLLVLSFLVELVEKNHDDRRRRSGAREVEVPLETLKAGRNRACSRTLYIEVIAAVCFMIAHSNHKESRKNLRQAMHSARSASPKLSGIDRYQHSAEETRADTTQE